MGLSSSKQTSKTSSNETGSTTPVVPPWLMDSIRSQNDRATAFGNSDPNQYVAGASPLQSMAFNNVGQLNNWQPQAAMASHMAAGAGMGGANLAGAKPGTGGEFQSPVTGDGFHGHTPQAMPGKPAHPGELPLPADGSGGFLPSTGYSPPPDQPGYGQPRPAQPIGGFNPALTGASQAGAYSDPYQQQVIDTSLASYDQNAAEQRAQMEARGAANHAFGGSRFGLAEGQFDADTALGRAQMGAQLRSQGFSQASQYGMQDAAAGNQMNMFNAGQQDNAANRQLAAAGLLGDLSNSYDANTRADLGTIAGLGDTQRGIEQDYAQAPMSQLLLQSQLLQGTPWDALVGRNVTGTMQGTNVTKSSPSLFSMLLNGASSAAQAYAGGMGG